MKRALKIAHLQLLPLVTGVQRVTLDELERLDQIRFDTYIICKEKGPMTVEAKAKRITCLFNKNLKREISPKSDLLAFWQLYRMFRKHRFDVVHSHSSKTGVIGRLAAKLAGVPLVIHTVHGYAFPAANSMLEKWIFLAMEWLGTKCSDKIICLHEGDNRIAKNILGAKPFQLEILANGVNTHKYVPATFSEKFEMRQKLGIDQDAVVIGMVGRLWKQKNPKIFVDTAINLLSNSGQNLHFILVGDGDLKIELENKVQQLGFADNIHFLGWRNDTPHILKALDIFVLPSLWEGMPLAILEAQSCGLPCIVSNIQGNNNLIVDGFDGFLFKLEETEQLYENIKILIDSPEQRVIFGKNAHDKVLKYNDIDVRIKCVANIYFRHFNYPEIEVIPN